MNQKGINKLGYFLFIYLYFYSFQIIKADEADECTEGCKLEDKKCTHNNDFIESCPSYCVPDLARDACYSCGKNMNSNLYYIFDVNQNNTCFLKGSCGENKLVFNTRQCVSNCTVGPIEFYEMDGICYTAQDCSKGNRDILDNTCICIDTYYRKFYINNNIYIRHCYNRGEICGPEHTMYDFDTKECGTGGCGGKLMRYETRPSSTNILRCSTRCKSGEFEYNGYCLDNCPETKFKYNDTNRGYICIDSCNLLINGNECALSCEGYIHDNNICKSTCDGPFYDEHNFVSRSNWVIKEYSSHNTQSFDYYYNVLDDKPDTMWHTQYNGALPGYPHFITIDMGETYNVSSFRYLTRKTGENGMVKDYELYLSLDGTNWDTPIKSTFTKTHDWQWLSFSPQRVFRYFKFKTLSEVNNGPWTSAAEITIEATTLKICTKSCGSSSYIENESCASFCSNGYYISTNNDNIKICVDSDGCYHKSDENENWPKYCYYSCTESGWPYYIGDTCYESCPEEKPYHIEGQFECLENCTTNYYLDGNTCYCSGLYAYTTSDNKRGKECYADEEACRTAGYFYRKGNECLKQCAPYFELELDNTASKFILNRCYNNKEECKSHGYYFYNSYKQRCWSTCPYDMWSIELDPEGKPLEDITKSTCVDKCGKDYPKYTEGTKVCKKECDNGQYYMLNETDKCIGECPYDYVGEDNECLEKCDNKKYYFRMDNGKFKCVLKCKDYNKFYVEDDPQCYDSCKDKELYYYYNSDHKCVSSCLETHDQYHYGQMTVPQSCKNTHENNYYYENKTLVASCPLKSAKDSFLCVESCGSKKIYENYCVDSCPSDTPYFIRSGNNDICVKNCFNNYTVLFSNECIKDCPTGYSKNTSGKYCYPNCKFGEKYNIDSGKCESKCPDNNKYYEKTKVYGSQEITVWRKSCMGTNKFVKDIKDTECVSKCPENNNFITFKSNVCTSKCESNQYFIETGTYTGSTASSTKIYQCLDSCPTDLGYFYVKDNGIIKKKCYQTKCPDGFNYIVENTQDKFTCLSQCPSTHPYYLSTSKVSAKNYIPCLNYNPCSGVDSYYFNGGCINGASCVSKKLSFVENKTCVSECSPANQYKTKSDSITLCKDHCESQYYIDSEKNCVSNCPSTENFVNYISGDKICKAQCDDNKYYYPLIPSASPTIYNCSEFCQNEETGYYLKEVGLKECKNKCTSPLILSRNERICYYNCTHSPYFKFLLGGECSSTCNTSFRYYYEDEKICLNQCKNGDFAYPSTENDYLYKCIKNCSLLEGDYYTYTNSSIGSQNKFCVKKCPSDKQYLDDKTCIVHCPIDKKFFVKEFKHSETFLQKKCLTDCPEEYPYYTIYKENDERTYGCMNSCDEGYKLINFTDKNKNAKMCIDSCPDTSSSSEYKNDYSEYKFKIIENNNKTCYSFCPPGYQFYKYDYSVDNSCYQACPDEAPFHEMNEFECKTEEQCVGDYIDYENKTCLNKSQTKCPEYKNYMSKFKYGANFKYICLNSCIEKYGKFLTPYNTCVSNCGTDDLRYGEDLIYDPQINQCFCKNLYIINETLKIHCLSSLDATKCRGLDTPYNIKMFDSKQCVKTCENGNVLSVNKDICYKAPHECGTGDIPNDWNSKEITTKNGTKMCVCKNRFYIKKDEEDSRFDKKVCLDEDGLCPSGYGKYIPETKKCLKTTDNCPDEFNYLFLNKFCLRQPPKNSTYNLTVKYYQCVKPNEYWHETDPDSGNYECIDKCLDKYPVYAPSTNQCLYKCTGSIYPYFYENKCYDSCNNSVLLNIENGFISNKTTAPTLAKYTCECRNPWFYNDVHKKICSDSKIEYSIKDCNNFTKPNPIPKYDHLVRATLQCTDKCGPYYNYTFNKECFESCEEAAIYYHYLIKKGGSYECQCQNLWFYQPDNYIQCLEPNATECVVYNYEDKFFDKKYIDKKYLVNETRECVNTCPSGTYVFNYACYEKCPIYTQDNQTDHICRCNKYAGYWYEYKRYNLTYLKCAVEKCPTNNNESEYIREYLVPSENKCIMTCSEDKDFPFAFRKICVKKCPYFTHTNDKDKNDTCLFYDLDDPDVDTIEKFKAATSIQAMELYRDSGKTGGFLYDKFNTTLQIYAIDRNDSLKEISFKSNLTYIDFGTCFEKIMLDKNISENESILITKYDITPEYNKNIRPSISENYMEDKYLINPVEYELYSSLTNEKLDALVCDPYEMLISYPLLLSKFDRYIDDINQNEYRLKFNMGKEIFLKDNEVDTFNYNNTIYTHFCKGLEYHGKDLVFEDRYKVLYPNNKLLCESNCTFNNTDFELERVNCLCTYKDVFDFNRTEEEINDILNDPDFYLPTQSQTNAEIIKCLFNFTLKQAVLKNEMFYCCSIMTLAQIVCVLICSITSVKDMINNIRHILNKVNIKNYFLKKNKFYQNNKLKNANIVSSTNRALNNPPKKNNNEDGDDSDNEDNFNNTNLEKDLDGEENKNDITRKSQIKSEIILDKNKILSSTDNKAEYIPPDYNFKFFKSSDKGVIKPIDISEIPFDINPDTKLLIERRNGIDYEEDYLYGPYLPEQNILIVTKGKIHGNKNNKSVNKTINLNNSRKEKLNNTKMEKTSKKRNIKLFDNANDINEKKFISTKKMKSNLKTNTNNEKDDFNPETDLKITDEGTGFFGNIRREQIYLREGFEKYRKRQHTNIYSIFFAEILDKIYFIKICLFLRKFDIFCVQLSLYIFYHILLLSLLCGFFTIKIIKKIWENDNFPNLNFYLLYGLIANVIVWIIYQIFSCVLDFHDRIKDMTTLKYELIENQYTEDFDRDNIHDSNEDVYREKYEELIYQIKCRIALFYVISFIFTLFFSIYLISFFSFYTGTKNRVLTAYYTSIIEILLIKVAYGTILAILRYVSKIKGYKCLYNFVFILDKYLS